MGADLERRAAPLEYRTAGRRLAGYAAVFDSPAHIGGFSETIRQGTFTRSLTAKTDILGLVDHDPSRLLARTGSGTLRLSQDSRGLAFELDLPDTALGRDILALAERRDLGGMSFGFKVAPGGDAWSSPTQRELRSVDLAEISVVQAWPAYRTTTVEARAQQAMQAAHQRRLYVLGMI